MYIQRSRIFFADLVLCNIYCEKPIFEKEFTTVRLITCGMLPCCCCCFEASFLACCLLFEHFFLLLHIYFCKVEPSRRLWHTIIIWRVLFFKVQKYTMFNPCFSGHGRRRRRAERLWSERDLFSWLRLFWIGLYFCLQKQQYNRVKRRLKSTCTPWRRRKFSVVAISDIFKKNEPAKLCSGNLCAHYRSATKKFAVIS